tara:strand:- start:2535 stop:2783 length:249 start_codon:yes stop_codon:yes gene_type:complete
MDKLPLKSKKFLAYLIADLGWKIVLFYVLYQLKGQFEHYSFMLLTTIIVVAGFIQVGYILGQAALDKYLALNDNLPKKKETP